MPITEKQPSEQAKTTIVSRVVDQLNELNANNPHIVLSREYATTMTKDVFRSQTVLLRSNCTDLLAAVFPLTEDEDINSILQYLAGTVIAETIAVSDPDALLSELDQGYVASPFANNAFANMPQVLADILELSAIPSNNVTRYLFRRFDKFRPLLEDVENGLAGFQFFSEYSTISYISAWRIWHNALVAHWLLLKAQTDAEMAVQAILVDQVIEQTDDEVIECLDTFYQLDADEQATLRTLSIVNSLYKEAN